MGKWPVAEIAGNALDDLGLVGERSDQVVVVRLEHLRELSQQAIHNFEGVGEFGSLGEACPIRVVDDVLLIADSGLEAVHLRERVLEEIERGQVEVDLLGQVQAHFVDEVVRHDLVHVLALRCLLPQVTFTQLVLVGDLADQQLHSFLNTVEHRV